jgi:hypothetical protein
VATPSATDSYTQASVSWSAPTDNGGLPVTGYQIIANDLTSSSRGGQTVSTTGTSTTITGLTPGDSYTFTITPQSALGNGLPTTSGTVTALASSTQITASLTALLHPTGKNAKPKAITKDRGYTFAYGALEPGRVVVDWYETTHTGKGKHKRTHRRLIASGATTAGSAQTVPVKVKLNALGRRLTKAKHPIHVTAVVRFTAAAGGTTSRTSRFTLR